VNGGALALIEADPASLGRSLEPLLRPGHRGDPAPWAAAIVRAGFCEPLRAYEDEGRLELYWGFEWLDAAKQLGLASVPVLVAAGLDRVRALALRLGAHSPGRPLGSLEAGALIDELVRSGLSLEEIAERSGRAPGWCERRLVIWRRLDASVAHDLHAGLIGPPAARRLLELPRGQQAALAVVSREQRLTATETAETVALLREAAPSVHEAILAAPRAALARRRAETRERPDTRLGPDARRLARTLTDCAETSARTAAAFAVWSDRSRTEQEILAPLVRGVQRRALALVRCLDAQLPLGAGRPDHERPPGREEEAARATPLLVAAVSEEGSSP
jgi:ParB-like chromosome segregation protein Spo0J